jgi:hypothetical protein
MIELIKRKMHTTFAADTENHKLSSQAFHKQSEFKGLNIIVCFVKELQS